MISKPQAQKFLSGLEKLYPDAASELINWSTPFQFLICIILSAQMTDKGVNKVTKLLFRSYPTSKKMAKAKPQDVEELIRSINYYKTKSKYLIQTAQRIESEFSGIVPQTEKELITLQGVGKKTAHVFLNDLYKKNEGIAVDTHVSRVAQKHGFSSGKTPGKIAKDLQNIYPQKDWHKVNATFVLFGRYICSARGCKCNEKCPMPEICHIS